MIAVIVSPEARADLTQIINYLASVASVGTASRWSDRLWLAFDEIAEFPVAAHRDQNLAPTSASRSQHYTS